MKLNFPAASTAAGPVDDGVLPEDVAEIETVADCGPVDEDEDSGAAPERVYNVKRPPAPQSWPLFPAQLILQSVSGALVLPAVRVLPQ